MENGRTDSATELAERVATSPELQAKMKSDPVGTLSRLAAPLESDKWIYRIVVLVLGATILAVVAGAFVLKLYDKAIPDVLVAIGTGAIGAIAGLLAPSPSRA